jgi:magnesium chelatase subunit I
MPITAMENVASNAERGARLARESKAVPRVGDVYAAMTSLTGKFELEYEGEVRGAEQVARELVRDAIGRVFDQYFKDANLQHVVQWFELGGALKLRDDATSAELFKQFGKIQGLAEAAGTLGVTPSSDPALAVAACEFILEGLHAHRKISRSEERGFYAEEPARPEPSPRTEGSGSRSRRSYQ